MAHEDKHLEDEIEDVPEKDVWTERINAFWNGCTKSFSVILQICQILGPILAGVILLNQSNNKTEIKEAITEAKTSVKAATDDAATNAKAAVNEAKIAASEVKDIKVMAEVNTELNKANLQQWKAYQTKNPSDISNAEVALAHAERVEIPSAKSLPTSPPP